MSQGSNTQAAESLSELLSCWDRAFVERAYWSILGRAPDPDGGSHHLAELRSGVSKLTILSRLRESPEGREHGTPIVGLDEALRRHRAARGRFSGQLVRWLSRQEGDSPQDRVGRAIANQLGALDHLGDAHNVDRLDSRTISGNAQAGFSGRSEVGIVDHLLLRMIRVEASLKRIEDRLRAAPSPARSDTRRFQKR